jgi:predicted ferric reductase
MTLSTSDMFAVMIALLSVNMVLLIAFRRVYVLERRLTGYKRELRLHQDPKIWND